MVTTPHPLPTLPRQEPGYSLICLAVAKHDSSQWLIEIWPDLFILRSLARDSILYFEHYEQVRAWAHWSIERLERVAISQVKVAPRQITAGLQVRAVRLDAWSGVASPWAFAVYLGDLLQCLLDLAGQPLWPEIRRRGYRAGTSTPKYHEVTFVPLYVREQLETMQLRVLVSTPETSVKQPAQPARHLPGALPASF